MPIRLWSTVVSHAHTSLPTCGPARGSASSGVAMLGWPPPSCRRCPLVPGGRSPSGAPEGQESHSRPPLARDCHAPRCAGRTADAMDRAILGASTSWTARAGVRGSGRRG
jgi:hypothetical protein